MKIKDKLNACVCVLNGFTVKEKPAHCQMKDNRDWLSNTAHTHAAAAAGRCTHKLKYTCYFPHEDTQTHYDVILLYHCWLITHTHTHTHTVPVPLLSLLSELHFHSNKFCFQKAVKTRWNLFSGNAADLLLRGVTVFVSHTSCCKPAQIPTKAGKKKSTKLPSTETTSKFFRRSRTHSCKYFFTFSIVALA